MTSWIKLEVGATSTFQTGCPPNTSWVQMQKIQWLGGSWGARGIRQFPINSLGNGSGSVTTSLWEHLDGVQLWLWNNWHKYGGKTCCCSDLFVMFHGISLGRIEPHILEPEWLKHHLDCVSQKDAKSINAVCCILTLTHIRSSTHIYTCIKKNHNIWQQNA